MSMICGEIEVPNIVHLGRREQGEYLLYYNRRTLGNLLHYPLGKTCELINVFYINAINWFLKVGC